MNPSQTTIGDGNIVAGGAVTIFADRETLSALEKRLGEVDDYFANEIGQVYSSRTNSNVAFSADKIVSSLIALDIHPVAACRIVFEIAGFVARPKESEPLTTNMIRLAVSKALMSIDFGPELNPKRLDWAKRYARRFGNPDQVLRVIHQDGNAEPLDYKYVKSQLLPHVIRRILSVSDPTIYFGKIISQQAVNDMAESILNEIKRLDVYSLRYKTLLYIAEDLAVQPPHPWFVSAASKQRTVAYDFERMKVHVSRVSLTSVETDEAIWQSIGECIHHACSGVLAIYGYVLGSRYLAPLANLRAALDMNSENIQLWDFCEIKNIESDLLSIQYTVEGVSVLLKRIERIKSVKTAANFESLRKLSIELVNIAMGLQVAASKRRKTFALIAVDGPIADSEALSCAREIISGMYGMKVYREIDRALILRHRSKAQIFSGVNALVILGASMSLLFNEIMIELDRVVDLMRAHHLGSNCLIFVHPDRFDADVRAHLEASLTSSEMALCISLTELRALASAADKMGLFEEMFLRRVA